jgi:FkbM family methyltransferase
MHYAHYLCFDALSMLKVFIRKLKNAITLIKELKNPILGIMIYLGLIKEATISLRNGRTVKVMRDSWGDDFLLIKMLGDLNVELNEDTIVIRPLNVEFKRGELEFAWQIYNNFKNLSDFKVKRASETEVYIEFTYSGRTLKFFIPIEWSGSFLEFYKHEVYGPLKVNNYVVIDVGASFGDTAMYFIAKGARKVIAVEPYERIYRYLLTNIALNSVSDKVLPINRAVWSHKGSIKAFEGWATLTAFSMGKEVVVEGITLSELIGEATKLGGPVVMKMDCEGCEYEAIPEAIESKALYNVRELIVEVHEKDDRKCAHLISLLQEGGFKVEILSWIKQGRPYDRVCLIKAHRDVT